MRAREVGLAMTTRQILDEAAQEYGRTMESKPTPKWVRERNSLPKEIVELFDSSIHKYVDWESAKRALSSWEGYSLDRLIDQGYINVDDLRYKALYLKAKARAWHTGEDPRLVANLGGDIPVAAVKGLQALQDKWIPRLYGKEIARQAEAGHAQTGQEWFMSPCWNPCRAFGLREFRNEVGAKGDLWLTILDEWIDEVYNAPYFLKKGFTYSKGLHYGDAITEITKNFCWGGIPDQYGEVALRSRGRSWIKYSRVAAKVALALNARIIPSFPNMKSVKRIPRESFWAVLLDRRNWAQTAHRGRRGGYFTAFRISVMPKNLVEAELLDSAPAYLKWKQRWEKKFGRVPKSRALKKGMTRLEDFNAMPVENFKWFSRLVKAAGIDMGNADHSHVVLAAWRLAAVLGQKCLQIWPIWWRHEEGAIVQEKPESDGWSPVTLVSPVLVHDAGINIMPEFVTNKELAGFLAKHMEVTSCACSPTGRFTGDMTTDYYPVVVRGRMTQALRVVYSWETLVADGATLAMPLKALAAKAAALMYSGVVSSSFAEVCAEVGVRQEKFQKYQEKWLSLAKKSEAIPSAGALENGGYVMYRLQSDDPRGIFLGHYTDCCQHPGGAGGSCAWHGHSSPDGAFFVVEKNGKIVAQSWAWRDGGLVVFDNVEALSGHHNNQAIKDLYVEYASLLVGKLGIKAVAVGYGLNDMSFSELEECLEGKPPKDCYTDADKKGYLAK